MNKLLREQVAVAEEYGYSYEGQSGSNHQVFMDRSSGRVVRAAVSPKNPGHAVRQLRMELSKQKNSTGSTAELFRRWMLNSYKIGRRGMKVVTVSMKELTEAYNAEHPEQPITRDHVTVMLREHPMFEKMEVNRSTGQSVLRIMGPLYGVAHRPQSDVDVPAEQACGATIIIKGGGTAVCTEAAGHSGLHFDKYRQRRWADGTLDWQPEGEPVIDPTAREALSSLKRLDDQVGAILDEPVAEPTQTPAVPVLEPVTVGGLTLSDELAEQLRAALAVPGAMIQAEAKQTAIKALEEAAEAVATALRVVEAAPATGKAPRPKRSGAGERSRLGRVQRQRLNTIVEAVADGRLPHTFTTSEVARLLDCTPGQAVSTLSRAHHLADTVVRVAQSTYEVRDA